MQTLDQWIVSLLLRLNPSVSGRKHQYQNRPNVQDQFDSKEDNTVIEQQWCHHRFMGHCQGIMLSRDHLTMISLFISLHVCTQLIHRAVSLTSIGGGNRQLQRQESRSNTSWLTPLSGVRMGTSVIWMPLYLVSGPTRRRVPLRWSFVVVEAFAVHVESHLRRRRLIVFSQSRDPSRACCGVRYWANRICCAELHRRAPNSVSG